jgi:alkylation response protein AidB-like acyl-CoA dehydrogenase
VCGFSTKGFGSPELTVLETGAMLYELGRADQSLALFMFLQNSLGISVLESCCSDEQKARWLPDLIALRKVSCFCLTEPENGSDATNMNTTARKVEGGYIVNGMKRWPGNSVDADLSIVWAKNVSDKNKI